MYLRSTPRRNKDGSEVRYLQLARNVWDPQKRRSAVQVVYNFGREDTANRAGFGGRWLVGPDRRRYLGIGAVPDHGAGDGAYGQRGHHQHDVAGDRGIEPGLALVEPEAVLAGRENLLLLAI
jgi:hypothetical protein